MDGNVFLPPIEKVNILLIEDNSDDAEIIRELLSSTGYFEYELIYLENLCSAEEYLSGHHSIDLILMDLSLSDRAGFTNIERIKFVARQIPVVILTRIENKKLAAQLATKGIQDYLVKGKFDVNEFIRIIRYTVERQRMVKKLAKAREIQRYLAYYDVLTELPNRELFCDRLNHALEHANRNNQLLGIITLDIDSFKQVNDNLGHSAGNELLQTVGKRLTKCVRKSDTVARISGDEFTVILNNISTLKDTIKVALQMLDSISNPIIVDNQEVYVTGSIGICLYPYDGKDVEMLLKKADIAMNRAKEQGRNMFEVYNQSMDFQAFEHFELKNGLRKALEKSEFRLDYQPLFDCHSQKITSVEALVRWEHPTLGLIYPEKFIPLAEKTGLIIPLGKWVIQTACEHNKTLQQNGYSPVRMVVNLSNRQFRERKLPQTIFETLQKNELKTEDFGVEITESSAMEDVKYTIETLKMFKDQGVQIAIDDFGTGYSSLNSLKHLPVDILKIDRTFIRGIPSDHKDKSMTAAIITMAHNLDLHVVAEGVETKDQFCFLRSNDCDKIQGYYVSRPLGFDALQKQLPTKENPLQLLPAC